MVLIPSKGIYITKSVKQWALENYEQNPHTIIIKQIIPKKYKIILFYSEL